MSNTEDMVNDFHGLEEGVEINDDMLINHKEPQQGVENQNRHQGIQPQKGHRPSHHDQRRKDHG